MPRNPPRTAVAALPPSSGDCLLSRSKETGQQYSGPPQSSDSKGQQRTAVQRSSSTWRFGARGSP